MLRSVEPLVNISLKPSRGLGRVLLALLPAWLGWTTSQALIGWLVFAQTGSPAIVGLAFALRFAPLAIAGVPAGALSDRRGRIQILQGSNVLAVAVSFSVVAISLAGVTSTFVLLAAAAIFGLADTGRMVSGNNLVYDLAGDLGTTRAVAVSNFVSGIGVALGGALSGFTLSAAGPAATATVVGVAYGISALLLIGVADAPRQRPVAAPAFAEAIRAGLALLRDVPSVRVLIGVALAVELFAFSYLALDPVFAGKVFAAGPAGLGVIFVARAAGRLVGSGILVMAPPRQSLGRALTAAILGFGLALVAYALAPRLLIAAPFILGAGLASVVVDAVVLTALQASVEPGLRGRVAGLWVVIVGLQPVGALEIGLVAQVAGARFALGLNGLIVAAFGVVLLRGSLGRRIGDIETSSTLYQGH
jgi:MFS transporter, DHA1 family, staphyloferrin A biosynthesis exporter